MGSFGPAGLVASAGLGLLGGGGGGGPSSGPGFSGVTTHTPAFRLHSGFTSDGTLSTGLSRLQTPELARRIALRSDNLDRIGGLIDEVKPGFGRLTEAAVQSVENARNRSIGNLRQQLAQRRVSGASFALDTEARVEQDFANQDKQARSEAILGEVALTSELIQQRANELGREVQEELAELQIAAGQSQAFMGAVSRAAEVDKQLAVQEAQGRGAFFGQLLGQFGQSGAFGKNGAFGGIFGGSSPSAGNTVLSNLVGNQAGSSQFFALGGT